MGRFAPTIDRALRRRQKRLEAAKRAQEDARRAAIPLYEKVMPLLREAELDLERAEIKVDYEPSLHFARDEDKQYLLFQLKPKSGIRTSVYRVAYNTKTRGILGLSALANSKNASAFPLPYLRSNRQPDRQYFEIRHLRS
jgi:hypothetical protein